MTDDILAHYPQTQGHPALPLSGGLINETFSVGSDWILQRLHPIFDAEVNLDIAALTPILSARGIPVPTLLETAHGSLWVGRPDGIWRLMTRLPGRTLHRIENAEQLRAAAHIFARFHGALRDVQHDFAFARLGVHDTPAHMQALRHALERHTDHRLHAPVAELAEVIFTLWDAWGHPPELPARIGHGDPKISNFLFDEHDTVVGVIDLDTLAWTTLDLELGDALRSWCNTTDESSHEPTFDLDRYHIAINAYTRAASDWLTDAERASFPRAVERICLELSSRFAADALNESYFGWDPTLAPSRGMHNLIRARSQLALARDAQAKLR